MYEQFYGFSERPFSLIPNPGLLFLSDKHQAALASLNKALENRSRFCVLTGDIGAGKTTLLLTLLAAQRDGFSIAHIPNANHDFAESPNWIVSAFGIDAPSNDRGYLVEAIVRFVRIKKHEGEQVALIIDEAQNLGSGALRELFKVSEATRNAGLHLMVLLFGQEALEDTLNTPELQSLKDAIDTRFHLTRLDEGETYDYIQHRIIAAGGNPGLFTDAACKAIYQQSNGVPRIINLICETALTYGFMEASPVVNSALVTLVGQDREAAGLVDGMWASPEHVFVQHAPFEDSESDSDETTPHSRSVQDTPVLSPSAAVNLPVLQAAELSGLKKQSDYRRKGRIFDVVSAVLVAALVSMLLFGLEDLQSSWTFASLFDSTAGQTDVDFATLEAETNQE